MVGEFVLAVSAFQTKLGANMFATVLPNRAGCLTTLLLLVTGVGFLTGCESPGRLLERSAVDQIRDGQTTRAEVDGIFGEPKQMTRSPAGQTLYYYRRFYGPFDYGRSSFTTPGQDEASLLILTVLFDPDDVVAKHLFSHTRPDVSRRLASAGRRLSAEELRRITPGKTTLAELGAWFGPCWSEQLTLSGARLVTWMRADAAMATGRVDVEALEVIVDENDKVASFRVTKQQP